MLRHPAKRSKLQASIVNGMPPVTNLIQAFVDLHGYVRHYFRKPGQARVTLPGLVGSREFMLAYQKAMAEKSVLQIGSDRTVPRSIRALAIAYYDSAAFKALKPITQGVYRNIIDRFCREIGNDGQSFGDLSAVIIRSQHVEKLMEARASRPDSANGLRKVLREMMKVAVKLQWRDSDPTLGVKKIKPKKMGGFHRWTDAEIAKFAEQHAIGTKARLAMALGLYTGQARQDVILIGEQHITREYDRELNREVEILNWVRKKTEDKTGLELAIPVHRPQARLGGKASSAAKGRSNRENRGARNPMQRGCADQPISPFDRLGQFRDHPPGA
jgi:hypothetical protein